MDTQLTKAALLALPLLILLAGWLRREPSREATGFSWAQWSYRDIVLVMVLQTAMSALVFQNGFSQPDGFSLHRGWIIAVVGLGEVLVGLAAIFGLLKWKYGLGAPALGFHRRHAGYYITWAIALVSGITGALMAPAALFGRGINGWAMPSYAGVLPRVEDLVRSHPSILLLGLLFALYVIVIVPVFEEIVFRGIPVPALRQALRPCWGGDHDGGRMVPRSWRGPVEIDRSGHLGAGVCARLPANTVPLAVYRATRVTERGRHGCPRGWQAADAGDRIPLCGARGAGGVHPLFSHGFQTGPR